MNSSFDIPQMNSARFVKAPLRGTWLSAWLQNETVNGYWVQFDADSPFRFVKEIKEDVHEKRRCVL
jgi:hypothetical protein